MYWSDWGLDSFAVPFLWGAVIPPYGWTLSLSTCQQTSCVTSGEACHWLAGIGSDMAAPRNIGTTLPGMHRSGRIFIKLGHSFCLFKSFKEAETQFTNHCSVFSSVQFCSVPHWLTSHTDKRRSVKWMAVAMLTEWFKWFFLLCIYVE